MKKLTRAKLAQFTSEWQTHNRKWRTKDATLVFNTLEEYIDYRHGRLQRSNRSRRDYVPAHTHATTAVYSLTDQGLLPTATSTNRKEQPKYSGSYVRGIALAHKSNYMVVGQEDDPESYAKMRRN